MGELLERITGPEGDGALTILHDHPLSKDRLESLAKADAGTVRPALLDEQEWQALKHICGGRAAPPMRLNRNLNADQSKPKPSTTDGSPNSGPSSAKEAP